MAQQENIAFGSSLPSVGNKNFHQDAFDTKRDSFTLDDFEKVEADQLQASAFPSSFPEPTFAGKPTDSAVESIVHGSGDMLVNVGKDTGKFGKEIYGGLVEFSSDVMGSAVQPGNDIPSYGGGIQGCIEDSSDVLAEDISNFAAGRPSNEETGEQRDATGAKDLMQDFLSQSSDVMSGIIEKNNEIGSYEVNEPIMRFSEGMDSLQTTTAVTDQLLGSDETREASEWSRTGEFDLDDSVLKAKSLLDQSNPSDGNEATILEQVAPPLTAAEMQSEKFSGASEFLPATEVSVIKGSIDLFDPVHSIGTTPVPTTSTAPFSEPTPPARELTPPAREPTPPAREPTPKLREPTPPPKREPTPPPKREPTPPPREPTPPPREPIPPPREPTPPPREPTPPPREPTPPPREPTPPPRKPTPPPREPTPPGPKPSLPPVHEAPLHASVSRPVVEQHRQYPPMDASTRAALAVFDPRAWFHPEQLDPRVAELIYWRDLKKSGAALGATLVLLLSLTCFSLISVLAYTALTLLLAAVTFRIYKNIKQAVQKTQDGHPFKEYLALNPALPADNVHSAVDVMLGQVNSTLCYLHRIFLVDDLVDSCKFGCYLWVLTYVGAWVNGLTLLILAVLALFSLPKAYEQNKAQVDQYMGLAQQQLNQVLDKVKAVIPLGGNKDKEQ